MRALRFIDSFHGVEARAWLLAIVRNTCFTWLAKNRPSELVHSDEEGTFIERTGAPLDEDPAMTALRSADARALHQAIAELPAKLRETLILRELEECSYKEIARIVDVPIGTVMSRLARAREALERSASLRSMRSSRSDGGPA